MSELDPKQTPPGSSKRFTFNSLHTLAVESANQINKTTQKYNESLSKRIIDLSNKAADFKKQVEAIELEITKLNKEINSSEKSALDKYNETLQVVVGSFDTPPPPWKASIVMQDGKPVGVDISQETQ